VESPATLDVESGFDFVSNRADPLDDGGYHGTGTASVLASTEAGDVLGAAPRATLVPMRVAQQGILRPEPVLLGSGTVRLRKAIRLAIQRDCHVISISLGWLGNRALHEAVKAARNANLVVVAAAGNYTGPFVVWPGRYSEVICMSGCDARRSVWGGSAFGSAVDFSAPAEDVWKAGFDDSGSHVAVQSSGTSFATAMTAGVAALWLAYHGRDALLERYAASGAKLSDVFREVLKLSADERPRGAWGWGPIVNVERALATPLPAPETFLAGRDLEGADLTETLALRPVDSLVHASEILGRSTDETREALARAYGVAESDLEGLPEGMGDELAFHALLTGWPQTETPLASEALAAPTVDRAIAITAVDRAQLSERLSAHLRV
jgi:thermitase